MSFDQESLYITRKSKQIVPLKEVRMSGVVRLKSRKYAFTLELQADRYYLGFGSEESAKRILESLSKAKQSSEE